MFPHFNLTRRPVYTYRRKTKLEFISDSSDDDSDLEDQKHQQRPTMVKVHEEGASLFVAGQTGAIEDKSFHIKSTKASANNIRNQKQPEEHVTPMATMHHETPNTNMAATTLVNGHIEKMNILEHSIQPTYEATLESHTIALDNTFTTTCKQDLEPLPIENLDTMDNDIRLPTHTNEEMETTVELPSDTTSLLIQQSTPASIHTTSSTDESLDDTTSSDDNDVFAFPTDPDLLMTSKTPKQKHVKRPCTKNEEMDIFDFPEDDPGEIRLMVASSLQSKSTVSTTTAAASSSSSSSSPSSPSSFISPTSSSSSSRKSRRQKSVRFAPNLIVSTFRKTSLAYSEPKLYPLPCCTDDLPPPPQQPQQQRPSLHYQPQKTSQKRKRNLVSRLKSANGQGINEGGPLPRYDFGDDDLDEADSWTTASVPESPERGDENLSQDVWMKMIEEALNDSNNDDTNEHDNNEPRRPRYQPQNPINVKVTYTRQTKKHPRNSQSDQELAELDNLLATLRNCK